MPSLTATQEAALASYLRSVLITSRQITNGVTQDLSDTPTTENSEA